ncbi:hypothetical protein AB6R08_004444 [Vibrio parahaemolyticus]|uniref:Uncharacterized protein n=1 Tax=Vibrio parahaemolyticus TaxID=670 RepID=A0AA46Z4Q7_VIBPH|nr:hypothetical protein [Vibrio parahaemolyticus]EIC5077142.1 hypothetical protein [Vibrio parahaemolyticus]EXJ41073.1 hypothetical protein D047_4705 [Vibrio parahaemolyticus VPTS-2010_2]MCC3850265.1 hypothetical protein [Vibrio parahaemolyticus]UYV25240.1 hypothetical protein M5598_09150 [Vibrio parahaemolyticus]HCJ4876808.1 hypothetical protein [Vibrio parahaemolyticus]
MSDWINILGGGLVVRVLNLWYLSATQKKKSKIEALEKQISHLYGPLHLYCSTNEKLSNLSAKLWETVGKYDLSEDAEDQTIEVLNRYGGKMEANNEDLVALLKSNLMYADPCDWHVLEVLLVDYTRACVELDAGKIKLDRKVYKDLGNIMFSRTEINQMVSDRYHEKKKRLSQLQGLS